MEQEKIGKFIAKLRKKKNLTQEKLAEVLGVNSRTISRWENGNYMPDLSMLKPICEVLDTSLYELLSGEEKSIKSQNNKLDYQIKFCYKLEEEKQILEKIKSNKELVYKGLFWEKTIQYDFKEEVKSFYTKEKDSRFRLRFTKKANYEKLMISYKKRINKEVINEAEEINIEINPKDYEKTKKVLEDVLDMKKVESYERYSHIFENDDIKIVLIRYPFMTTLELINLSSTYKEELILYWLETLKLNINDCYNMSWHDKYRELCLQQNKEMLKDVEFGKEMPHL